MSTQTWLLEVSRPTAGFLGGADKAAQWRTPPLKALLRQWWRVAVAKDCGYDAEKLREQELALFGAASDDKKKKLGKSKVRLRLEEWRNGGMRSLSDDLRVFHPEVGEDGRTIGSQLYLGYGPIGYQKGQGTVLNVAHAIAPGESNTLWVSYEDEKGIREAIRLACWFGTMGSRSRNGWGSVVMTGEGLETVDVLLDGGDSLLSGFCRPLEECLRLDWPHAFGMDENGVLVWKSRQVFDSWEKTMKHLAEVKIAFRTAVSIKNNHDLKKPSFEERHVLAYPVTNHGVDGWVEKRHGRYKTDKRERLVQSERLANQIRFKVVKSKGQYCALVYHLPCDIPSDLKCKLGRAAPSLEDQIGVWRKVHRVLDAKMTRLGGLV
ncbi:hypothetical protein D6833_06075 [Candidatus Parcubacteria bacterium]|nr:MAG: hypothetical protein D6833_06075 [Candidatus Parcubacteria bacterium]